MTQSEAVRRFIVDELNFSGDAADLTDDFPLLEREVVDSMGIFRIVGFLEDNYDIEVDDEDLVPDNFGTIADIDRFVAEKKG